MKIIKGIAVAGCIGAAYYIGYSSKHLQENATDYFACKPGECKEMFLNNPAEYKKEIIEITKLGIRRYHTDLAVESLRKLIEETKERWSMIHDGD